MALAQLDRNVALTRYAALRLEVSSLVASVDLLHFEYGEVCEPFQTHVDIKNATVD
jgi:hypothetical protein